jgi:hypothetical protein
LEGEGRGRREERRGKREEERGKREEGRGKREEGRGKREEGRGKREEKLVHREGGRRDEGGTYIQGLRGNLATPYEDFAKDSEIAIHEIQRTR